MHPLGTPLIRVDETPSTSSAILENPDWLAQPGLVMTARHQTAGRGRVGRRWASVPGSQLQCSMVLQPQVPAGVLPATSLMLGLAVALFLEEATGVKPSLKWPNDVRLNGQKVCGILVESRSVGGNSTLVAGVGINLWGAVSAFPAEVQPLLTTVEAALGETLALTEEAVLAQLLAQVKAVLTRWEQGEMAALLAMWKERAELNRPVRYRSTGPQGAEQEAVAVDVSPEGYLVVEAPSGQRTPLVSAEVEWL